jgi:hypothetical protein
MPSWSLRLELVRRSACSVLLWPGGRASSENSCNSLERAMATLGTVMWRHLPGHRAGGTPGILTHQLVHIQHACCIVRGMCVLGGGRVNSYTVHGYYSSW